VSPETCCTLGVKQLTWSPLALQGCGLLTQVR
jgi:hypothetical protein